MFFYTGPVIVNFQYPRYTVEESSGLITVNVVTSYPPRFAFEARVTVLLSRQQGTGYGAYVVLVVYY